MLHELGLHYSGAAVQCKHLNARCTAAGRQYWPAPRPPPCRGVQHHLLLEGGGGELADELPGGKVLLLNWQAGAKGVVQGADAVVVSDCGAVRTGHTGLKAEICTCSVENDHIKA